MQINLLSGKSSTGTPSQTKVSTDMKGKEYIESIRKYAAMKIKH